jgi:molybdopterin-dependent oxidoreductase alpha subunit
VDEQATHGALGATLDHEERRHPSGGWGSLGAVTKIFLEEHVPLSGARVLARQNKTAGFMCVSCAWAKPARPHAAEFCETGAKATAWEITGKRIAPDFFARHTLAELRTWGDHELEAIGRLMLPMRWDAATDRYVEVAWQAAFDEIGRELRALDPKSVVFYASGRASLEASYLYQLFARMYGCNNLPDSSNMCHESTSVALPKTIGVPIGTVRLEDFETTEAIFFFGQNVGTNSPRMLHQLHDARRRGIEIVTFNPLRERGLVSFVDPQSPREMLTNDPVQISTQYHQLRTGGDTAVLMGMIKHVIDADDRAIETGTPRVVDHAFIAEHTHGFDELAVAARGWSWTDIERESGLIRAAIEAAADVYIAAGAVIGVYGMGLTQHREGVQNVQMLSNLLLLRGNIGRPGAGICPVRGHSNVQGQRTVGITEKPELAPLDAMKELHGFEPPRDKGLNTVDACEKLLTGEVCAFIGLGGNFIRAVPDTERMEAAWTKQRLTVQVSTKLNRNHLVHGEVSYVLPCLGRIEIDRQASGPQIVSVEDSTGSMHASRGQVEPAGEQLRSEIAIVAALAEATLPANPKAPWRAWVDDYATIRDTIAAALPEIFHDFNARLDTPGGFPRPNSARERVWKTPTGKATFIVPRTIEEDADLPHDHALLRLTTIRSDDQFNTTIYSLDDRFRDVKGTRRVLLMHRDDVARLALADGDAVTATTVSDDGLPREVHDLRVKVHDIPRGCVAGYYPECNPLIPLSHHARESKVPAAKAIPIRVRRASAHAR